MEGFACRSGRWLVALGALLSCVGAPLGASAQAGAFELTKWEAGTCIDSGCTASKPSEFYTQAAGHPPYGITDFRLKTEGSGAPEGHIEQVRVDIPKGLSVDPLATPQCKLSELEGAGCPPDTQVGKVQLTAHVGVEILGLKPGVTIEPPEPGSEAIVYNMEPPPGHPLEAAFKVSIFETIVHIVGGIQYVEGIDHEFFTIKEIPKNPELIESRLIFEGTALGPGGTSPFITMPSTCLGPQTSYVGVDSYEGQADGRAFTTPVGASGCDKIPFAPTVKVTPSEPKSDAPDGATIKVEVPQNSDPAGLDSSMLKDVRVTLPEGVTLNPAAASGLEACADSPKVGREPNPISCPPDSMIGTVTIETPDLPPGSLTGNVYLDQPISSDPASGDEYRIFIDAEAPRYGVYVQLEGHVSADPATGQLTTAVLENPQVPFSDFTVDLEAGSRTPLANPLGCGPATTTALLTPYSGAPTVQALSAFAVDLAGLGASCPGPPFAIAQSAATSPTTGGATTSLSLGLNRGEGQQYLSKLATVLPPGLVGKIPAVTLCGEPQAAAGDCTAASQIGTVAVTLGSGPTPLSLSGIAYLTTSYGGAPYGLSVVVPAEKIGPYDYGRIVTRAAINVDPRTARIIVTSQLPTIVGGAPLRLRSLSVNVNRPNFTINPTNCSPLSTDTTLTSTFGAVQSVSSPFQATGCSALPFAPKLTASTNAKTSKADGAIFVVKVAYPPGAQANIKSVYVALPKQLPSRISTLNKACPAATFEANPAACPPLSRVGTATVSTPVLPGKLTGPAMFVSHGGAAFPDLDLVLSGDGVTVILVGNTNIAKGITSSTYAAVPDVPVSSFEVRLPRGRDSVLGAVGSLCKKPLIMPTTITAQNAKAIKQNTKITVGDCPIVVLSHRVRHHKAILVVKVPAAGRISVGGKDVTARHKHPGKARDVTIVVPLSRAGRRALAARRHHRLTVKVRLGFVPKARKLPHSSASATVVFR